MVSEHVDLDSRWQDISVNPLFLGLAGMASGNSTEIEAVLQEEAIRPVLRAFAGRTAFVGFAPLLGQTGQPAVMISSWVGRKSRVFGSRALGEIAERSIPANADFKLEQYDFNDRIRIWFADIGGNGALRYISFAAADGVLMACASADPTGVRFMAASLDKGSSVARALTQRHDEMLSGSWMDRAWLIKSGAPVAAFGYRAEGRREAEGELVFPSSVRLRKVKGVGDAFNSFRLMPDVLFEMPLSAVVGHLQASKLSGDIKEALNIIASEMEPSGGFFLSVLGGEASGRVLGIRVPTIMAGAQAKPSLNLQGLAGRLTDHLSANTRLKLIPKQYAPGVVVIDSVEAGVFSSLQQEEKPALAVRDGRLLFVSNVGVIAKLAGDRDSCGSAPWREEIKSAEPAAFMWADLETAGVSLKNGIAVYSLMLALGQAKGKPGTREMLDRLMDFLDSVSEMETLFVGINGDGKQTRVTFRFGPETP